MNEYCASTSYAATLFVAKIAEGKEVPITTTYLPNAQCLLETDRMSANTNVSTTTKGILLKGSDGGAANATWLGA